MPFENFLRSRWVIGLWNNGWDILVFSERKMFTARAERKLYTLQNCLKMSFVLRFISQLMCVTWSLCRIIFLLTVSSFIVSIKSIQFCSLHQVRSVLSNFCLSICVKQSGCDPLYLKRLKNLVECFMWLRALCWSVIHHCWMYSFYVLCSFALSSYCYLASTVNITDIIF